LIEVRVTSASVAFGVWATYTTVPGGRIAASSAIESSSCEVISVDAPVANSTIRRFGSTPIDGADTAFTCAPRAAIGGKLTGRLRTRKLNSDMPAIGAF